MKVLFPRYYLFYINMFGISYRNSYFYWGCSVYFYVKNDLSELHMKWKYYFEDIVYFLSCSIRYWYWMVIKIRTCFASSVIISLFRVRLHYGLLEKQCPRFIHKIYCCKWIEGERESCLSLVHYELLISCNEVTELICIYVLFKIIPLNAQYLQALEFNR